MNTDTQITNAGVEVSNVGNAVDANPVGTFRPYDSQLPIVEPAGFRAVKCLYKKNMKTGKVAGSNSYVLVKDHITAQEVIAHLDTLVPYFISYLQEQEDKMIKERHLAIGGGVGSSSKLAAAELLSMQLIVERLESSELGARLNGEKVAAWFTTSLEPALEVAFAQKIVADPENPTDAEVEKVQLILGAYKAKFMSLASGKTVYRPEEAERLQAALQIASAHEDTAIGTRFSVRLEKMIHTTTDSLLMSL